MKRVDIITKIGRKYLCSNVEEEEFSYAKALKSVGKNIKDYQSENKKNHSYLDIRFENERLAILVECKNQFSKWDKIKIQTQLQEYVRLEKEYSDKKIVAILAETDSNDVWVWYGQSVIIDDSHKTNEIVLKSFEEYEDICFGKINDKIKVVDSIKSLNDMLYSDGVHENLRSQFVGTCLLALKNGLHYKGITESIDRNGNTLTKEMIVIKNIKDILEGLLARSGSVNRAGKLSILNSKVLDDQDVTRLGYYDLVRILDYINDNIIPYINDKNTAGQDLLSLFFTAFNKYVGKSDKNQAFTPDHICDFMSKAVGVNKHSRVLDPCCGSGAFLVRAMTDAMDDCDTEEERENVKKNQIYGIEYENGAFGLSSTNMLIHGDGNSNVVQDSMFNRADWIEKANINIVLMNPPYNATRPCCNSAYTAQWKSDQKEDPSKGFHFVEWVCNHVSSQCRVAVLLPMQAAIGNSKEVKQYKRKMLERYTLDAVFSLPSEIFYPGASAVACCMIFDLSQNHARSNKETFFGYFRDDKFVKRKSLGRVETTDSNGNSLWSKIEDTWLNLYRNKKEVAGLSVMHMVSSEDEWLAEAYMETDYTNLNCNSFKRTLNKYLSYLVGNGDWMLMNTYINAYSSLRRENEGEMLAHLDISNWKYFSYTKIFRLKGGFYNKKPEHSIEGNVPFLASTENNNGVTEYYSMDDIKQWSKTGEEDDSLQNKIYDGNCIAITVDGSVCNAYYQSSPFTCSHSITALYLKNYNLTPYIALFLCTVIMEDKYRWNYGRKPHDIKKLGRSLIKLPVDSNGEPNWAFMEDYIKSLPYGDRI